MRPLKLTPRLQKIADQIQPGAVLADIGTDHAYLPVYLLQCGKICQAIASDIRSGPLESARRTAEKYNIHKGISLRLGSGLEKIREEECDTIVIAGMGGENIRDILKAAPWTSKGAHTLFLQPMSMAQELRYALLTGGYEIQAEFICREEEHLYNILQCRGIGKIPENQVSFGACVASTALLQAEGGRAYLEKQAMRQEKILWGLRQSQKADQEQLRKAEETMEYLQTYLQKERLK